MYAFGVPFANGEPVPLPHDANPYLPGSDDALWWSVGFQSEARGLYGQRERRRVAELEKALADPAIQPPWLPDLLALFGWQGGTYTQALEEVRALVTMRQTVLALADRLYDFDPPMMPRTVAEDLRVAAGRNRRTGER